MQKAGCAMQVAQPAKPLPGLQVLLEELFNRLERSAWAGWCMPDLRRRSVWRATRCNRPLSLVAERFLTQIRSAR